MLKYQSKEYVNIVLHKLNCISAISGHENQDVVNCFIESITCHVNVTHYSDSKANSIKVWWLAFFYYCHIVI